jgi:hypothetical protein
MLQSAWLNHECATKYIAGYFHGTYLPPLYTESSAEVVADNTILVQNLLDRHCRMAKGGAPLVLLEMPPPHVLRSGKPPDSDLFPPCDREGTLRPRAGRRPPVDRVSLHWGLANRFSRAICRCIPERVSSRTRRRDPCCRARPP